MLSCDGHIFKIRVFCDTLYLLKSVTPIFFNFEFLTSITHYLTAAYV